jgi:hypothetical protein
MSFNTSSGILARLLSSFGKLKSKARYRLYDRVSTLYPAGHFYSPVNNPDELALRQGQIWHVRDEMPGVQWLAQQQLNLLQSAFKKYAAEIDYPMEPLATGVGYYYNNDQYPMLDAEVLHCMLCHFRPKRMVEIGSGFSSLITADVNRRILNEKLDFTCVEPYPRQFLVDGVPGISKLVVSKVEDLELNFFTALDAGDILFIDSSHVAKTGSDVNYLFFEIIPRLKRGVLIHIHDIFLPDEYPKKWVLDEGRSWNEQYLLRAFLQFNPAFEIVWGSHYMATRFGKEVQAVFPRFPDLGGGGSIWIRKIA